MNESEIQVIIEKADKLAKPNIFSKMFGSATDKYFEAIDLYKKACNL